MQALTKRTLLDHPTSNVLRPHVVLGRFLGAALQPPPDRLLRRPVASSTSRCCPPTYWRRLTTGARGHSSHGRAQQRELRDALAAPATASTSPSCRRVDARHPPRRQCGGGKSRLPLQIFSDTLLRPVFFEFIQRKGDDGFGEGNFTSPFQSIEKDQVRRCVLAV